MNTAVETEAELQARLEARLRAALPLLPAEIRLEHHLHLRLGHHRIDIDGLSGEPDATRGRYDFLVLANGKALLMVELKAPEVDVTEDDVRQVRSYATAHEPLVPLVCVTNGTKTVLQRYDGHELQPGDVAAERLASVLASASSLAASASEDAVRTLLGSSRDVWSQMLANWNCEAVAALTGEIRDLRCPIARALVFERQACKEVAEHIARGERLLVVHGPPLSGITNALVQIAADASLGPIVFIDGKACSDVLQFIANRISRELLFGISKDHLRVWLNTIGKLTAITLVVDGLPRNGVDELAEYATSGVLRLVLGIDSETFRRISTVSGRAQESRLGRAACGIKLEPLSDEEFYRALEVLEQRCDALFFNGAQHSPQLRWPRTLRVLAASLPPKRQASEVSNGRVSKLMLRPIPGPALLESCSRAFASEPSLKFDLRSLAHAYLKDADQHATDPDWLVATWGRPSIDPIILEDELGMPRIERLRSQGFLSWVDTRDLGPRVLVRVEELLVHHVADEWSASLSKCGDRAAMIAELDRLLRISGAIPRGELALAAAIVRATEKNEAVLSVAIPVLIERRPTTSQLQEGAVVELLVKDARIRLHFGKGMDEEVVGDLQPWLVLSHIASQPMAVDEYKATANFSIFLELGVWPHLLYQPPATELAKVPGFYEHEIEGIGSVPCLSTGIVEPLLQAMVDHAHQFPNEMVRLAQLAMERKEAHLAWRVLTVAIASKGSTDPAVEKAATDVADVLREWWGAALTEVVRERGSKDRPET